MNLLQKIARKFKVNDCERLVHYVGQELNINLGIEGGGLKINLAEFSNQIRQLVEVSKIAQDLDDTQYLLCLQCSKIEDRILKAKCIQIRLMLVVAFNQLRIILTSIKEEPTEELRRQLLQWITYMDDLHRHSIAILDPMKTEINMGSMPLSEIVKYQRLDEKELTEAVKEVIE